MKRRKKKRFDFKYKIIFVMIGIVFSIVLLFLSFNNSFYVITGYINDLFYYPFRSLTNNSDVIGTNMNLELQEEITSLKKVVNISSVFSDFELINGVVISRNPSYWLNEVVVNRGSRDGVEVGMGVVVSEGLVGYVNQVYSNCSYVTLITNNSYNNTSVKINNAYLILEYDKMGNLIVNQLDNNNSFEVGDVVLTSGLTDKYPSGITVGYVSKIEDNTYGTGKILYISLYYDINSIRYVSFLKRLV